VSELFLFGRFHARPGCDAAVREAIRAVERPTRLEAGCVSFQAFESVRVPGEFYIHSRWRDRAAFDLHASLPHTAAFLATVEPLVDHPLSVSLTEPMEAAPSSQPRATLIFFCGKMAAGKSTLAQELARREGAALFVQDDLLDHLYPGEILDIPDFTRCSARLRNALAPHVAALLAKGTSVVLDFPANTPAARAWFREIFERAGAAHELHFIDAADDVCKRQLRERSRHLPPGSPWTSDAEFDAITAYFRPPADDERFNVIRHARG
jgi:quinol monooxygenase YgiN/predicted kinase